MSGNQSKLTRHVKKQETLTHNKEKNNLSIETHPETAQMTELKDKSIKFIVTIFYKLKKVKIEYVKWRHRW